MHLLACTSAGTPLYILAKSITATHKPQAWVWIWMDTKTKQLDEATPDLEQPLMQPSAPTAAEEKKVTGCSCDCDPSRAAASPGISPTAARTLALVAATAGLVFAVDLGARGDHATLAVFAAGFMVLCASSSLFAWCVGRKQEGDQGRARAAGLWPETAAARVLLWSFATALVVSMTSWVSLRTSRAAGYALSTLGFLVGLMCLAEVVPTPFRSREQQQPAATTRAQPT